MPYVKRSRLVVYGLQAWTVYRRISQTLERGTKRVTAEITRPLLYRQENSLTAIYPHPLRKDSIRLLTILDDDHADGTIHCRLETYPVDIAPRYDAVSYCWGDHTATTIITCNGFELQVPTNLTALLKASKDRQTPSRPLWIDAICLNQEDNVEKNIHVPLMSSVYQRASRTIVWLGDPDIDTEDALSWLTATVPDWVAKRQRDGVPENERIKGCGQETYPKQWKAMHDYLSRPWFERLWCLQEVLLARDIHILCHTKVFPVLSWEKLYECMKMLPEGPLMNDQDNSHNACRVKFGDDYHARNPRRMELMRGFLHRMGPEVLGMPWLRYFIQTRTCREPVDRVWGLLGLLPPKLVTMVREADIIDYSEDGKREYWKSYLNFMKILHEYDASEFLITIFEDLGRGRHPLLPSWCPDFTRSNEYMAFRYSREFRAGFINDKDDSAVQSTLSSTGNLSILGFQVDTVASVTPVWEWVNPLYSNTAAPEMIESCRAIHGLLERARQLWETTDKQADEGIKSLCSTLVAPDYHKYKDLNYTDDWPSLHERLEESVAAIARGDTDEEVNMDWPYTEHRIALMNACDGRRVFTTKHGRFGLGAPDLQEGDMICTFIGAEPLFVLREVEGDSIHDGEEQSTSSSQFKLVGDAYVYGMMFGEAFKVEERGPRQHFVII